MRLSLTFGCFLVLGLAVPALPACSPAPIDDGEASLARDESALDRAADGGALADPQLPPVGTPAMIDAWLAKGFYRSWTCEDAPHASRPPSGHSPNRVCSNARLSAHGSGEYPVGAASVKELFDASGTRITGHAIALKTSAGGGDAWYWFERIGDRVVANGLGTDGPPKTVCTRCHLRAGSATFGHDLVYTQVR